MKHILFLLFLAACTNDTEERLDAFFSLEVHDITIDIDEEGLDSLAEDPREYVAADLAIDDDFDGVVGVKLKGRYGSFVPINDDEEPTGNWAPGKVAMTVDFNRIDDNGEYLGLTKLTLNNLRQDPSGSHEYLGYALFREGGVPASRATVALVTLNDEDKGLYAVIESQDNATLLESWFGNDEGTLYEGEYGVDLWPEWIEEFDQDHGEDVDFADLEELVEALDEAQESGAIYSALDTQLDLEAYLAFAATEVYLGHWDGYAISANNYALYNDPDAQRWSFLPWGIDQVFQWGVGPYDGVFLETGPAWPGGGRIHQLCFESEQCKDQLREAFLDLIERVDAMDLTGEAAELRALIEPLLLERAFEPEWTEGELDQIPEFIEERPAQIERWLPCLVGETVDWDEDEWDDCTEDCDARDDQVFPGAAEVCNFRDDDCNGVFDDDPDLDCPRCLEVEAPDGHTYGLCPELLRWEDARDACVLEGGQLASIHDWETMEVLGWSLVEVFDLWWAWIGLNDRNVEGAFVWEDGSSLDFTAWDETPQEHSWADCVLQVPWSWYVLPCDEEAPYICRF
jgi:hypothetical protein